MFKALFLENENDEFSCQIKELDESALPEGEVIINVEYSTINYKDGLAICGRPGIVRSWPMVPGIDLAGVVESSDAKGISPGDKVTVNGWDLGEAHWGGLAQKARVNASQITPIPDTFSTFDAASIGTAGYTAMLCVLALEEHGIAPDSGEVLVTGAAGGVGSVAVALLSKLGYQVTASSGRAKTEGGYLKDLGASEVIDRAEIAGPPEKPMGKTRWAGCVDPVGGDTLATVLTQIKMHGCVAACGLADSPKLNTSVMPFILRSVTLAGINCVYEKPEQRELAWNRLAADLNPKLLEAMTEEVGLDAAPQTAEKILKGEIRGRVVVNVNN